MVSGGRANFSLISLKNSKPEKRSECRAFLLEKFGAESNGIKFQNDNQSGKSSS